MAETQRDVVDLLTADHRQFDRVFCELEELLGNAGAELDDRKQQLVGEVSLGLARHSVAEEAHVYPRVHEQIDAAEARRCQAEHELAERTMKRLERLHPSDEQFDTEVRALIHEIRMHVAHEEGQLFSGLRATFSHAQLVEMGDQVEQVMTLAAPWEHPLVPDEGVAPRALGPVAALLEHLRAAVGGRGPVR
ncbi:hemerythrin domain-containing protein [Geodermatophilus ruber]|uniref:Hemerythrin HHE cation binding domain-containing protein n=1 Tax=Geodermatophilus ruber TaxID=504800 RepID=A0A1I4AEI2_9ACTN|nr:hemerythrin domain-containing protein [Geodermatophilus ruber]SFK54590.1 Hemerythrin HHE cation binding domain-containing protein [Geodermatophilus ruber]